MQQMNFNQYLIKEHVIAGGICNLLINAGLTYWVFAARDSLSIWGEQGIAADLFATSFVLPFILTLIVMPIVNLHIRQGKIAPITALPDAFRFLSKLPQKTILVALANAFVVALTLGLLLVGVLYLSGITALSAQNYILFKSIYCGLLGAALQPLVAMKVLSSVSKNEDLLIAAE